MSPGPVEPRSSHEGSIAAGPGRVPGILGLAERLRRQGYAISDIQPETVPTLRLTIEWPPSGPSVVIRGQARFADSSTFDGVMDGDLGLLLRLFAGFDPVHERFRDVLDRLHKDATRRQHRLAALHQEAANEARDRADELGVAWGEAHTLG